MADGSDRDRAGASPGAGGGADGVRPSPPPRTEGPEGPPAIWAPWRLKYLEGLDEGEGPAAPAEGEGGVSAESARKPEHPSFLVEYWLHPERDAANRVVERSAAGMILLNAYPYSNGHLLVALGEPRPRLLDYDAEQRAELWRLVDRAAGLMERALEPQGINIGINQGRAGGAGVPQHLHAHVVPRWSGDVNFITTVGQIRVVPSSLEAMYARYRRVIEAEG